MTPVLLFSIFAIVWAVVVVTRARRRFGVDGQALAYGLVAAVVSAATVLLVGFLVGRGPAALGWVLLPAVVVVVATVLAERRRSTVLRSRRRTEEPAHGA